jgi:hypothetical protein
MVRHPSCERDRSPRRCSACWRPPATIPRLHDVAEFGRRLGQGGVDGGESGVEDSHGPALLQMHRVRRAGVASTAFAEQSLAREWVGDRPVIAASDTDERVAVVWQIAGPGGEIAETIVLAGDDDTLAASESRFLAP